MLIPVRCIRYHARPCDLRGSDPTMLIVMKRGGTRAEIDRVLQVVQSFGLGAQAIRFDDRQALSVSRPVPANESRLIATLPGVEQILPLTRRPQRVARASGQPGPGSRSPPR